MAPGHEDGENHEDAQVIAELAAPGPGLGNLPGLVEGPFHVGHHHHQGQEQDHHSEDPQGGHLGVFNILENLGREVLGTGGQAFQEVVCQQALDSPPLEEGKE